MAEKSWQKIPSALSRQSAAFAREIRLSGPCDHEGDASDRGTTMRYTQVSRAQVKEKLKLLKG